MDLFEAPSPSCCCWALPDQSTPEAPAGRTLKAEAAAAGHCCYFQHQQSCCKQNQEAEHMGKAHQHMLRRGGGGLRLREGRPQSQQKPAAEGQELEGAACCCTRVEGGGRGEGR